MSVVLYIVLPSPPCPPCLRCSDVDFFAGWEDELVPRSSSSSTENCVSTIRALAANTAERRCVTLRDAGCGVTLIGAARNVNGKVVKKDIKPILVTEWEKRGRTELFGAAPIPELRAKL